MFRRLDYLVWNGVRISADHRNLAGIFNPKPCIPSAPLALAQCLKNLRKCFLRVHIRFTMFLKSAFHGGGISSVAGCKPRLFRSDAIDAPTCADYSIPSKNYSLTSKEVVQVTQQSALV